MEIKCVIYSNREKEVNQKVDTDLRLCHVSCSGTYWSNWWLMTLAKLWLQMNKEPDKSELRKGMGRLLLQAADFAASVEIALMASSHHKPQGVFGKRKKTKHHNEAVNFHLTVRILLFSCNASTMAAVHGCSAGNRIIKLKQWHVFFSCFLCWIEECYYHVHFCSICLILSFSSSVQETDHLGW